MQAIVTDPFCDETRRALHPYVVISKTHVQAHEKHQTSPNRQAFCKIPNQYLQLCQGSEKQGKIEKQLQIWRQDDQMHYGIYT